MIDDDLENSGLRELIEKGREQGYITFADINDYLPDEVSDPDQLDEVIPVSYTHLTLPTISRV